MEKGELIAFSERFRGRVIKSPPLPHEVSDEVTNIEAYRYRRELAQTERRAMQTLLADQDA